MFKTRLKWYKALEKKRNSRLLVYVTGDRLGLETQIHQDALDYFGDHLDKITGGHRIEKLSLFLYSRGGQTAAAWSIANLLKQFCKQFEVIVPARAHSAATIICLGASSIIMTKQATLGPIDPNFNGLLNPIPNIPTPMPQTVPVSVEAINGFFQWIREDLKINDQVQVSEIVNKLTEKIHPLVLGEVFRARNQIKMLATRLLAQQISDSDRIEKIVSFLTADSGSHDYTINRQEAEEELKLPIEKPDDELYGIIEQIYADIRQELNLNSPFIPMNMFVGEEEQIEYSLRQAIIESPDVGTHAFVKEGIFSRSTVQMPGGMPQLGLSDQFKFQGWKYEPK
ncbi:MAG: serine protease [Rectinemataceae bacterium]